MCASAGRCARAGKPWGPRVARDGKVAVTRIVIAERQRDTAHPAHMPVYLHFFFVELRRLVAANKHVKSRFDSEPSIDCDAIYSNSSDVNFPRCRLIARGEGISQSPAETGGV